MGLLCPDCRRPLDESALTCPNGHRFHRQGGVLVLLDDDLAGRLAGFLEPFSRLRAAQGRRLTDPAAYPDLPFGPAAADNHEWRLRQHDLAVVTELLAGGSRQRILDVGAWNGWLSNRLAAQGHQVTAVDYFIDPYDGLGARAFYDTSWRAIQMNLEDLEVLGQRFDMVIVNRCLQFFADPVAYAVQARAAVAPGGLLVLTGLAFLRDPSPRLAGLEALQDQLREHGLDFFKPLKGYLDFADKTRLEAGGTSLRPYPGLWPANLKSRLVATAPRYYYGLWRAGRG